MVWLVLEALLALALLVGVVVWTMRGVQRRDAERAAAADRPGAPAVPAERGATPPPPEG